MANTTRNHRPASERRHNRQKPEQEELLFDELSLDPDAKSGAPAEEGLGFEELDLGAGAGSRADRGHSARAAGETGVEGSARRKARELTENEKKNGTGAPAPAKKFALWKRILIWIVLEAVTLTAIFGYGYVLRSWNLIERPDINEEKIENTNLSLEKKKEMEGYWNIAVFGVDGRDSKSTVARGLNSDVIIIASINRDTGAIKLCSVFRDTYLNISERNSYNKINQAYSQGGPEQALAALNKNLDLNIKNYVTFNWKAVADGINILGGVDDIEISRAEHYYINAYITETVKSTGVGSVQLSHPGVWHLDGVQAVAYGRLRYMDSDYARTERQKKIIKAAFEKAKKADFSVLNNIMVVCFPQVATNIGFNEIVRMAQNITKYNIADTGGFPFARGEATIGKKGACVIPATLESNVIMLHDFLYGDTGYQPSDAVLRYSQKIKEDSRLYREGTPVESVRTDGGLIPSTKKNSGGGSSSETKAEEYTIGVGEDGELVYPTDANGDIVLPTDADGNIVYPTDADGNQILPTDALINDAPGALSSETRPSETSSEGTAGPGGTSSRPGGSSEGPGVSATSSSVNTNPTASASGGNTSDEPVTAAEPASVGTPASEGTAEPGSGSSVTPGGSAEAPGSSSSVTPGGSSETPGGSSSVTPGGSSEAPGSSSSEAPGQNAAASPGGNTESPASNGPGSSGAGSPAEAPGPGNSGSPAPGPGNNLPSAESTQTGPGQVSAPEVGPGA